MALTGATNTLPRGIGPATIRDNRKFFGLEPFQYITVLCKETKENEGD
jgi:hypothetical protein